MTTMPKLTTTDNFTIEEVTRKSDTSGNFAVTIRFMDGERRTIDVSYQVLLDFGAFSEAALFAANVLLRHQAEDRSPKNRFSWLKTISEAIERSTSKEQRPQAGRG